MGNTTGRKIGTWIGLIIGLLGLGIGVIAVINPGLLVVWMLPLLTNKGFLPFVQNYLGLLIFAFVAIVLLIAFRPLIKASFGNKQKKKRLMAIGAKIMAKVISVQDTGITVNDNSPLVKLLVEVKPGSNAEFTMLVSRVSIPRAGDMIEVYYDPSNPSEAIPV